MQVFPSPPWTFQRIISNLILSTVPSLMPPPVRRSTHAPFPFLVLLPYSDLNNYVQKQFPYPAIPTLFSVHSPPYCFSTFLHPPFSNIIPPSVRLHLVGIVHVYGFPIPWTYFILSHFSPFLSLFHFTCWNFASLFHRHHGVSPLPTSPSVYFSFPHFYSYFNNECPIPRHSSLSLLWLCSLSFIRFFRLFTTHMSGLPSPCSPQQHPSFGSLPSVVSYHEPTHRTDDRLPTTTSTLHSIMTLSLRFPAHNPLIVEFTSNPR